MSVTGDFDLRNKGLALFFDIENIIGHCSALGLPIRVRPIYDKLKVLAPIRFRRAFGDIAKSMREVGTPQQIITLRRELSVNLVEIQDIPFLVRGKNSADIHIVATALSLAYENPNFTHFAFVASDRDFVPLYSKLKELGKIVIAVSVDEQKTASIIQEAVDYLFYYEQLPGMAGFLSREAPAEPGVAENADPAADTRYLPSRVELFEDYVDLMYRAGAGIQNEGRAIMGANLCFRMRQLQSDFDPERVGFPRFKNFLEAAQQRGCVALHYKEGEDMTVELLARSAVPPVRAEDAGTGAAAPSSEDMRDWSSEKFLEEYKKLFKTVLKIAIPPIQVRERIFRVLEEVPAGGMTLRDYAKLVEGKIRENDSSAKYDEISYKILLSLYFSRAFNISHNDDKNNPTILSLACPAEQLSDYLARHYIATILHKSLLHLDIKAFASLYYEDCDEKILERCCQLADDVIYTNGRLKDRVESGSLVINYRRDAQA